VAEGGFVKLERRGDGVAVVRLDGPPANALCKALLVELRAAAEGLTRDPPGAVVVTGSERIFAAGADISEFGGPADARAINAHFREALEALVGIPRVTIAAVTGYALGGGCELALACDLRVAAGGAKLGQPEILPCWCAPPTSFTPTLASPTRPGPNWRHATTSGSSSRFSWSWVTTTWWR